MIVKSMLAENKIILCVLFLLLLTIILYGIAKAVINMTFSPINNDKENNTKIEKLDWTMYTPQIIMLLLAFALGLYLPQNIANLITNTVG